MTGTEPKQIKPKQINWKELGVDILVDIAAGMLIAIGVYNFALNADFPVAGFSGIALILYHLMGIPVGTSLILLNVPVSIFCYKFLGKTFFFKSVKTVIISSFCMDYIAPLFPVYTGDRLLAALCMGILAGAGYAIVFMRGSSTGGQDFITMSLKKVNPHISLGVINFTLDSCGIVLGSALVFKNIDGLIYGIIVSYLMGVVMNRILYGTDAGKVTLIVTEHGEEVAACIDEYSGRGSTILKGIGSYSKKDKAVVMCACNNKQMYAIKKVVHEIDPKAFTVIMESNEVVGEGFKEEVK